MDLVGGLYCKFGTQLPIQATLRTDVQLICYSRPYNVVGSLPLEISNNNQDFTSDNLPFIYQPNATVIALSNTHGPQGGGTLVNVTGSNLFVSPNIRCKFGTTAAVGTAMSTSRVLCQSPIGAVGHVAVEVANNGLDYTTDGVQFTYDRMRCVHGVNVDLHQLL